MVTCVPAAVFGDDAGSTWTTSGAAGVDGVGNELGVTGSTSGSDGLFSFMKICVYWPALVSASPITPVVLAVFAQLPRMVSRWPQHPPLPEDVQSRLVPP